MDEVFEQKKESVDEYLGKLAYGDSETGMAIFIGGEFCGLELFDDPATLEAIYGKLLSGYVADALVAENGKKKVAIKDLKVILKAILGEAREIPMEAYPAAVGVGLDERYKGNLSIGKSLSFEDDTIHFCAFSK